MSLDSILDLPFTFFFIMLLGIEQTQNTGRVDESQK